jgi:hypothetical protein
MFPRERSNIGCTLHMGNPCEHGQWPTGRVARHVRGSSTRSACSITLPLYVSKQVDNAVITPYAPARIRHLVEPRLDRACDANDCISMAMVSCPLQPSDIGTGLDLRIVRAFSLLFFFLRKAREIEHKIGLDHGHECSTRPGWPLASSYC